jgi:ribonuclease HII
MIHTFQLQLPAKVRRDEYMVKLHELFPSYEWNSNKGYLSPTHISAIKKYRCL